MLKKGQKRIALLGLVTAGAFAGLSVSDAVAAMTTLKQVQVSNGSQIDLLFDGKIGKSQARTEFFNDVIQISLNDVSVYPAKISSVNGGPLVKIFAYQYAPKLVRCRLTVSGKAEDYKDRLQIVSNGKVLSLRLAGEAVKSDQLSVQAAHPVKAVIKEKSEKPTETAKPSQKQEKSDEQPRSIEAASVKSDAGQAALLERVMKSAPSKPVPVAVVNQSEGKESSGQSERARERKNTLSGGKPLPSPMGVLAKLLGVIGLFGAMAFVAKKFFHGKGTGSSRSLNARLAKSAGGESSWMNALGGFARSAAAGLGRKDKMIEVLSNHYLGPKKSIAVVRVMGRTLVLGVTNDSINLISQMPGTAADGSDLMEADGEASVDLEALLSNAAVSATMDSNRGNGPSMQTKPARASVQASNVSSRPLPGMDATGAGASSFSAMMQQEVKKPAPASVRNQIRSRLEGLKQL